MKLIWVHADCLHRQSAAYREYPGCPSLFVWDEAAVRQARWSMKRIGFIYECLLELPVVIRRGDPVSEVARFAGEMHCSGVVTMESPDPRLRMQAEALNATVLPVEPFAVVEGGVDLARFSRYWRKVERLLPRGEPKN